MFTAKPVTLTGSRVRLDPLTLAHEQGLISAAADGELWNLTVTTVPTAENTRAYIETALAQQANGSSLPFVTIDRRLEKVVGCTRFLNMHPEHARVEIGNTWLSASAQKTIINSEAKLMQLTLAFEEWRCNRVEFLTDALNEASRTAIRRLGAREEAVLRNHMVMPNGRIRDSVCHSILVEDWPAVKKTLQDKIARQA